MFLKIYNSGCLAAGVLKATKTYIHCWKFGPDCKGFISGAFRKLCGKLIKLHHDGQQLKKKANTLVFGNRL